MQLIDFALLGLAIAAPTAPQVDTPALTQPEVTTCPDLDGASVQSTSKQGYHLQCAKFIDAPQDQLIKIVTTTWGYKGCLEACDDEAECGFSQYIATDEAQTQGSCTLFKRGSAVKQGSSNSWTLATKTEPFSPIPRDGLYFSLHAAIYNGTELLNVTGLQASNSRFTLGGPPSNASCDAAPRGSSPADLSDYATFFINNGSLYLHSGASAKTQRAWIDRSGMGQGIIGYTTAEQSAPKNAERQGFALDATTGNLEFKGTGAVACPPGAWNEAAGWSVWFTTSQTPGGSVGCVPVGLRAVLEEKAVGCEYTQ